MKICATLGLICCLAGSAVTVAAAVTGNETVRPHQNHTRKPALPVSIATTLPQRIEAGESLTLQVDVVSLLDRGELIIEFVADEGVELQSPLQEQQFTLGEGGLRTTIPLTVIPATDGRHSVTVDIRHVVDGRVQGTARGITFRAGDAPIAKAVASKPRQHGDAVVSLPAQETVIRKSR
jgi:hypothetical protein